MRRAFASFRQSSLDGLTGGMTTRAGYGGLSRPRPSNRWLADMYPSTVVQVFSSRLCKFVQSLVANVFEDVYEQNVFLGHKNVFSNSVLWRNNGLEKDKSVWRQFFGWRTILDTQAILKNGNEYIYDTLTKLSLWLIFLWFGFVKRRETRCRACGWEQWAEMIYLYIDQTGAGSAAQTAQSLFSENCTLSHRLKSATNITFKSCSKSLKDNLSAKKRKTHVCLEWKYWTQQTVRDHIFVTCIFLLQWVES